MMTNPTKDHRNEPYDYLDSHGFMILDTYALLLLTIYGLHILKIPNFDDLRFQLRRHEYQERMHCVMSD
jgi:hypothetical protein